MLLKLLKYEFKSTWQRFLSSFAVYAVLLAFVLIVLRPYMGWVMFLTVSGLIGLFVILFMTLFQRYSNNLYGSEGYLMFTLPVRSESLLLSKLIPAVVWVLCYCAVVLVSVLLLVVTYGYGQLNDIHVTVSDVWRFIGQMIPFIVGSLVSIIFTAMAIYFAITVGKLPLWGRAGGLMGFVAFCAANFVQMLPGFFTNNVTWTETVNGRVYNMNVLQGLAVTHTGATLMWLLIGYVAVVCAGLFFATAWLMNHKTSLK